MRILSKPSLARKAAATALSLMLALGSVPAAALAEELGGAETPAAQEEALSLGEDADAMEGTLEPGGIPAQTDPLGLGEPAVTEDPTYDGSIELGNPADALTDTPIQDQIPAADPQIEAQADTVKETAASPTVSYRTHVQTYGNQSWVKNGKVSGTFGQSKRLEAIWIKLSNTPVWGSLRYRTHVQSYGWQDWVYEGQKSGTSGQSKRLEAIQIELYGWMADEYDIWYRVHAQHFGWMGWARNGAEAGTAGYGYRLEAIQILLKPKGSSRPSSSYGGYEQARRSAFLQKKLSPAAKRAAVLKAAYSQLGVKYEFGACSPGKAFDCSGFTKYCYGTIGYTLPHSSEAQAAMAHTCSLSKLQPGDLIFWVKTAANSLSGSHVAIYLGNGQVIHANGTCVKVGTLSNTWTSCGSII